MKVSVQKTAKNNCRKCLDLNKKNQMSIMKWANENNYVPIAIMF